MGDSAYGCVNRNSGQPYAYSLYADMGGHGSGNGEFVMADQQPLAVSYISSPPKLGF